jgi:putative ABC transport system substrate-binding protein
LVRVSRELGWYIVRWLKAFLAWLGLMATLLSLPATASGKNIVVLAGDNLKYTKRTISGARSVIKANNPEIQFYQINIADADLSSARGIDSIKTLNPSLILTVGSAATRFARDNFSETPIIFAAVMYPAISGFVETLHRPGKNLTGSSLDIPAEIQFDKFRQIIPTLRRIGVLYTNNTSPLIEPSRKVAESMGMSMIPIRIDDLKEIPKALDSLAKSVDGIWSVADPNLFSPQSTKYILLNSLRKGLPFMGFSRYVVESGALFALDFDYKAIGRQAGDLANKVLDGARPGRLPVTVPDIIWFHYNEKTAQHLNCTIPDELVAIAKEVYR